MIANKTSEDLNDSSVISPEESTLDEEQIEALQLNIPEDKVFASPPSMAPVNFAKPKSLNKASRRALTVGNLDSQSLMQTGCIDEDAAVKVCSPPRDVVGPPIPLRESIPISRMNRSFGSNKQYRRALASAFRSLTTNTPPRHPSGTQYQPSRENSLTEIGLGDNLEDLAAIFLPRKRNGKSQQLGQVAVEFSVTAQEQLEQQLEQLAKPIPMDERQWSIPSIRMANHLNDISTASYTCSDADEEDSLYWEEDIIVSNIPESIEDLPHEDDASEAAVGSRVSTIIDDNDPYEWLRQVRESENVLAEAASSKFLTNRVYLTPMVERQALQTLNSAERVGPGEGVELWKKDRQKGI